MNGVSALLKEFQRAPLSLSTRVDAVKSPLSTNQEARLALIRYHTVWCLNLGLPGLQKGEK